MTGRARCPPIGPLAAAGADSKLRAVPPSSTPRHAMAVRLAVAVLLSACSAPPPPYRLHPGPPRPGAEVAVVELSTSTALTVDGAWVQADDWPVLHLLPGRHTAARAPRFDGLGSAPVDATPVEWDARAGHAYRLVLAGPGPGRLQVVALGPAATGGR